MTYARGDAAREGALCILPDRLIASWNAAAQNLTGYEAAAVIGKRCSDGILDYVDDRGRSLCGPTCPLLGSIAEGRSCEIEAYMSHRDGYRVPVLLRAYSQSSAGGEPGGWLEVLSDRGAQASLDRRTEQLRREALLDPLTEAGNSRYLEIVLRNRMAELRWHGASFGVIIVRIDASQSVATGDGVVGRDAALCVVAKTICLSMRPFDCIGRWNETEIVAVLPHVSQLHLATMASRCRALTSRLRPGDSIGVSVSVAAALADAGDSTGSLLDRVRRLNDGSRIPIQPVREAA